MTERNFPDNTPKPPYYAVVFSSRRTDTDADGYAAMADRMMALAARQRGYLGVESVREGAAGITVSYWRDLASIRQWKRQVEHREAQRLGRERWYERYRIRVCRVEREYGGP